MKNLTNKVLFAGLGLNVLAGINAAESATITETKGKNIVFIFTDQQRKQSLGVYGADVCKTPNIDKLAADGIVFDQAYCTTPICSPARASIQTGLYPFKHGMQTNIFQHGCMIHELRDDENILSRRLIEAGYNPLFTGKWHLGYNYDDNFYVQNYRAIDLHINDISYPARYQQGSAAPSDFGYIGDDFPGHGGGGQSYAEFKKYLKDKNLEENLKFWEQGGTKAAEVCGGNEATVEAMLVESSKKMISKYSKEDKPFCLILNFWGPHAPYRVPSEYLEQYRNVKINPWPSFRADLTDKPSIHNVKRAKKDVPWEIFEEELRYYYASVSFLDAKIGELIQYLKDNNLYDDTIIIFSADHGDSLGIHNGLMDKGIFMYEDTVSIPLIVKAPNIKNRRSNAMINTTDIYSTILDYAGVASDKQNRHGRSFKTIVEGKTPCDWPKYAVTECSGIGHILHSSRMIKDQEWKYVFNSGDMDELYNLAADPYELKNLINEPACQEQLDKMRIALYDWLKQKEDRIVNVYKMLRNIPSL